MVTEIETLGILEEIQSLVSDNLQVVSYKWLSRNFLVSSNAAKRLLQDFVEKHGVGLEVVYTLSGWLKNNPSVYHIRLVSGPKVADAKQEFNDDCSVQVYSVQACIPKDPAALWNAEFVQAEELFKQPFTVGNCLRDNRFCGISNSFVKRNAEGTTASILAPQPKSAGLVGPSKSTSVNQTATVPQPQQTKVQKPSLKVGLQSPNTVTDVKTESCSTGGHEQAGKSRADKEKVPQLPANKRKGQNDKSSSGTGGSLGNMWGRASAKSKPSPSAEKDTSVSNSIVSADAQICAREASEDASSDDDQDVNFKRAGNGEGSRKRRVVFDYSDEEEYGDAVNLASPDLPKTRSSLESNKSNKTSIPESKSNPDKTKEDKSTIKEQKVTALEANKLLVGGSSVVAKQKTSGVSPSNKIEIHLPEKDATTKNKAIDVAPNSPKRRKVLKTRIDERGREVNEVVWEGEEAETKPDNNTTKKADNYVANNTTNRPPAAKKSPALGSTAPSNPAGKAGNKKAATAKDPKQGNIMSFFKRV